MNIPALQEITSLFEREFDYGRAERVEVVTTGYLSSNWIIHTPENIFFLKKYRSKFSPKEILAIHEVMRLFEAEGIPTINPLPTRNEQTVLGYNNGLYSLFPYVSGNSIRRDELEAVHLAALGTMLALIHDKGTLLPHPRDLAIFNGWDRTLFLEHINEIKKIQSAKPDLDEFDRAVHEAIEYKLSHIFGDLRLPEDFFFSEYVVMHGDFHEQNVFFDDQALITHVFDWEKTAYGPRAFEFVRSLYLICIAADNINAEQAFARAKIFFDAYQKRLPITEEEFRTAVEFYYVDQFYSIWIERLHYQESISVADKLLKESVSRIQFLEQYREEFVRRMFNDTKLFNLIP
jgi:Ser/Thr protein kinase RdoA (MazF antagonist)